MPMGAIQNCGIKIGFKGSILSNVVFLSAATSGFLNDGTQRLKECSD